MISEFIGTTKISAGKRTMTTNVSFSVALSTATDKGCVWRKACSWDGSVLDEI